MRRDTVVRTGGLLCSLKEAGAIDAVGPYLERLVGLGFRLSPKALDAILEQAGEGR